MLMTRIKEVEQLGKRLVDLQAENNNLLFRLQNITLERD